MPIIWRKLAKNRQKWIFLCPYHILGFLIHIIDFYIVREHWSSIVHIFWSIALKIWRKLAKAAKLEALIVEVACA